MAFRFICAIWAAVSAIAFCDMMRAYLGEGVMRHDLLVLGFAAMELTAFMVFARGIVKGQP